jgi:hypothetical protein
MARDQTIIDEQRQDPNESASGLAEPLPQTLEVLELEGEEDGQLDAPEAT